jgi:lysophospholipase L1-like esterase
MMITMDVRVTVVGDSYVAGVGDPAYLGWVGRVAAATPHPLTVYNLGVRGDTSAAVAERWDREVAARRAPGCDERLVLAFGVNDTTLVEGGCRVGAVESVAHLRAILTGAAHAGLSTLVVGPPPVDDAEHVERTQWLSADFAAACVALDVPFVDVIDELAADPDWSAEVAAGDGAHPGAAGYAAYARIVLPHWLRWLP